MLASDLPPVDAVPPAATLQTAPPHPDLAAHVLAYVGIEQHATETASVCAMPTPVLMVSWGAAVLPLTAGRDGSRQGRLPLLALAGPFTRHHRTVVGAGAVGFHIRLQPTGARALLGVRPLADDWEDALPADVTPWAEAIAAAPSFEARVALADAFWRGRAPASRPWAAAVTERIAADGGAVAVGALAAALSVHERTLRRRFFDDVGLGVKAFARLERYRQAHGFLLRTPGATWRDACERFGYADQAHFVREFHRCTGEPPTQWKTDDRAIDLSFGLRGDRE